MMFLNRHSDNYQERTRNVFREWEQTNICEKIGLSLSKLNIGSKTFWNTGMKAEKCSMTTPNENSEDIVDTIGHPIIGETKKQMMVLGWLL